MAGPPPGPDPDAPTPAERRLAELLAEVRGAPVPEAPDLTHRVVRTARWQRGVREALSSIGGLTAARIKVGDQYVAYTPEAAAEALGTAQRAAPDSASDYSVDLDRRNLAQGAYPIVLISYAIACTRYEDPGVARTVKSYLEYAASGPGQREAAAAAGNAPLSGAARRRAVAALSSIDTE